MDFLTIDIFLIIFIGMGPVKVLLLYIAATKDANPELQRKVARKAVMTATIVGVVLLLAGVAFMRLLHFSRGALTIAGGIILLLLALGIVLSPAKKEDHEAAPDEGTLMSMAVYPLGIPMLLNPIGIVALTVFSAEAQTILRPSERRKRMTNEKQEYTLPPNNPALIQNSRYPSVHFNSAQTDVTDLPAWIGNWQVEPSQTRWLPGVAFRIVAVM